MIFYKDFSIKTLLVTLTAVLFTLTACSNPASSDGDDHDHHEEPVGAVLTMNGQEIARYDSEGVRHRS